jgi:hypothetical protein
VSALSKILRDVEGNGLMFWCPGCDGAHMIRHGAGEGPRWSWNGNVEKPTFSPSILVRGNELTPKGRADLELWRADLGRRRPAPEFETVPSVCHSFVTDGRIQFLADCTHHLAGQTVDIPEWDDDD